MEHYTTETNNGAELCFHFRVPPEELETHAGASDRAAAVRRITGELVSEACRKAAARYPDIVYFKPEVCVSQDRPGAELIFSARVQTRPDARLCDYRAVHLTPEDCSLAENALSELPEDEREATRLYLLQSALIGRIARESTIEIPRAMVDERARKMAEEFKRRLEMGHESIDDYYRDTGTDEKQMIADFARDAKTQLGARLTLLAIAREEGLEATQADYDEQLKELCARYPLSPEQIGALLDTGEGARLRQDIAVSKAAGFVAGLVSGQLA